MDIEELLSRTEGKTLEFKRNAASPAGLLRTVAAFANTAGGTIVIGVDSRDRSIHDIADPLMEEERVANLVSDAIRPQLVVEIGIVAYRGKSLIVVEVFPGPARPYHVASDGMERGSYVRVGSTNRTAGPEVIAELRRANTGEAHDEQPLPRLDAEAIDYPAAVDQFESVRKLRRSDLLTLGVLRRIASREVPTVGGVILFGKDRREMFPDAAIELGQFAGQDRTDLVDMQTIDDMPIPAIDRALAVVLQQTRERFTIRGSRRRSIGRVPESALREAIVNAVVHADYSMRGSRIRIGVYADRVEIDNPGLLPFGMTIDDMKAGHSKLRNRVLGRVFREVGLIEQWGTGIQRMTAACRAAGIADPHLEELGTHFRVVFSFHPIARPALSERDTALLEALATHDNLSTAELAEILQRTTRTVRNQLSRLVDTGHVTAVGSAPNDPRRTWRIVKGK
ncbi:MAG: putative DNA binding domain-containing protein [Planctomycetes bacterium]|nr:putative DNA binding domain-containing protein [Planctomycetota bacterium]